MQKSAKCLISNIALLILISSSLGQSAPVGLKPTSPAQILDSSQEIFVSSGDLLAISVAGAPKYHYDVRVSSGGDASLPMVGNIKLAGLSTLQAEGVVSRSLEKRGYFNDPQVSVLVKEYATGGISVLGEVQKPGIYPLLEHRTLLDAISVAGGTTPKAGKSVSITHRDQPENPETIMFSLNDEGTMSNRMVRPGDTIEVSKAGMVYVVGDVKEPTGIIMDNPHLTVLQAIALAHGTNSTASLGSAKLIRKGKGAP